MKIFGYSAAPIDDPIEIRCASIRRKKTRSRLHGPAPPPAHGARILKKKCDVIIKID